MTFEQIARIYNWLLQFFLKIKFSLKHGRIRFSYFTFFLLFGKRTNHGIPGVRYHGLFLIIRLLYVLDWAMMTPSSFSAVDRYIFLESP